MRSHLQAIGVRPILLLVLLGLTVPVMGYGFHDALFEGNSIEAVSTRSAALAASKVFGAEGPTALFINPAALCGIESFRISLSGSMVTWGEVVVDSTSQTKRAGTGVNAATGALALRVSPGFVLSGGVARVADNQYDGTHFLPNDPTEPDIDRVEILNASGGIWEALGGVAVDISENMKAGVSAGLRFGRTDFLYSFDQSYTPETDSTSEWTWEKKEFCYHAGFMVDDGEMGIGFAYTSSSEHYPGRIAGGARVLAEHLGNSTIGFEAEVISPFDENSFFGKLTVQMPLREDMNIMTGVGFYDGANMERTGMAFSLGGNIRFDQILLETAVFYSGRSRRSTSFPQEYSDNVEDNWTVFSLGASYGI